MIWVGIALAGALGAVVRYLVDVVLAGRLPGHLPWGTMVINITGSFLAGLVAGLVASRALAPEVATILSGGFLGAYTTFSTAMYESVVLLDDGARREAVGNLLLPLFASVAAAALGWGTALA